MIKEVISKDSYCVPTLAVLTLEKRVADLGVHTLTVDDFWIHQDGKIHLKERITNVDSFASLLRWLDDAFDQLFYEVEPKNKGEIIFTKVAVQAENMRKALSCAVDLEFLEQPLKVLKQFVSVFMESKFCTLLTQLTWVENQWAKIISDDLCIQKALKEPVSPAKSVEEAVEGMEQVEKILMALEENPNRYKEKEVKNYAAARLLSIQGMLSPGKKIIKMESSIGEEFFLKPAQQFGVIPFTLRQNKAFLRELFCSISGNEELYTKLAAQVGNLGFLLEDVTLENREQILQCLLYSTPHQELLMRMIAQKTAEPLTQLLIGQLLTTEDGRDALLETIKAFSSELKGKEKINALMFFNKMLRNQTSPQKAALVNRVLLELYETPGILKIVGREQFLAQAEEQRKHSTGKIQERWRAVLWSQ